MKLPQIKADIPGVGQRNLLNVGSLLSLTLGVGALAFVWGYGQTLANKARAVVEGTVAGRLTGQAAPAIQSTEYLFK